MYLPEVGLADGARANAIPNAASGVMGPLDRKA